MFNYDRDPDCEICAVVDDQNQYTILRTEDWVVNLAPDQLYIGRVYITALDHLPDLPSLGPTRAADLYELKCQYEAAVKKAFDATHITYAELGNHGYRTNPPHAHFHAHVRPRYREPVQFAGLEFADELFGNHHSRETRRVPEEVMRSIAVELRTAI
jgi:diadenosine tetraphosphate (Ap4A) HIT family hydrolase